MVDVNVGCDLGLCRLMRARQGCQLCSAPPWYPQEPAATLSIASSIPPFAASWGEAAFWGVFNLAWKTPFD